MVIAAVVVIVVMLPMMSFIYSHVSNPRIARFITEGAFLALVVLVAFLANWWSRDSA